MKNQQLQTLEASQPKKSSLLPPINSEEDKTKLREQLEAETFEQRQEVRAAEKKSKQLTDDVEALKKKLKEKETTLRIAKFKLSEVNRNIEKGKVLLEKSEKDPEVLDPAYVPPKALNKSGSTEAVGTAKQPRGRSMPASGAKGKKTDSVRKSSNKSKQGPPEDQPYAFPTDTNEK